MIWIGHQLPQAKAKDKWEKLSEDEQKQVIRISQCSLSFILSSFYNYLAVIVHGKKLTQLIAEAMAGNNASFCLAVHIDKKTLNHIPYFKQRYQRAIQEGEEYFLGLVNYRLQSPQLKGKVRHQLLYMLFALLEPRKISWARIYSASYWFHGDLKKS